MLRRAAITSVGRHLPERVMTSADLEKIVDTNDEWIRTRTGIEARHIAEPGTPTSEMCLLASRQCLELGGVSGDEIDLIIVATITPDKVFPATACILQEK